MKTQRLTEFKEGTDIFISTGISKVKVTRNGEVECLEVPVQSTGISDLITTFEQNAPTPPLTKLFADPNDPNDVIAKEMKIAKKTWIKIPDLTDSDYLKQKEEHDSDMGTAILMKGMAVIIRDKNGEEVEDDKKKIETLKGMGMSADQFTQIVDDITSLTRWSEEEKEHFFENPSDSQKMEEQTSTSI